MRTPRRDRARVDHSPALPVFIVRLNARPHHASVCCSRPAPISTTWWSGRITERRLIPIRTISPTRRHHADSRWSAALCRPRHLAFGAGGLNTERHEKGDKALARCRLKRHRADPKRPCRDERSLPLITRKPRLRQARTLRKKIGAFPRGQSSPPTPHRARRRRTLPALPPADGSDHAHPNRQAAAQAGFLFPVVVGMSRPGLPNADRDAGRDRQRGALERREAPAIFVDEIFPQAGSALARSTTARGAARNPS
jgi:hypothetical protein